MRTTLTLEDDVARALRDAMRRTGRGLKEVVNEALRRGFRSSDKPARRTDRFVVTPRACGFVPGIDPLKLNQQSDELEMEAFLQKARGGKRR